MAGRGCVIFSIGFRSESSDGKVPKKRMSFKTRGPTTIGWTRTREWGGGFEKEQSFYGAKEEEEGGASFLLSTSVKASSCTNSQKRRLGTSFLLPLKVTDKESTTLGLYTYSENAVFRASL